MIKFPHIPPQFNERPTDQPIHPSRLKASCHSGIYCEICFNALLFPPHLHSAHLSKLHPSPPPPRPINHNSSFIPLHSTHWSILRINFERGKGDIQFGPKKLEFPFLLPKCPIQRKILKISLMNVGKL